MLNQKLQQKLLQKLSPQQIQLMKLLQIPAIALEQRIKEEIEENPALEEGADEEENEINDFDDDLDVEQNPNDKDDEEFNFSDYLDDDDTPSYKLNANNQSADDERKEIPFVSGISFQEQLLSQLGLRIMGEKSYLIATQIIGNIDDAGYLQRELNALVDDLAFSLNIVTSVDELKNLLEIIQEFDPPGVGAKNLQECLLLQLKRSTSSNKAIENAIEILSHYFDDFTKKHYDKISKKMNLDTEEIKSAVNEIIKLNPKPGNTQSETSKSVQYILPDFYLTNEDGILEISLNNKNAPELRISRTYSEMMETYSQTKEKPSSQQKDAMMFVKQKIDSAKWFMDAIKQRHNTLEETMKCIAKFQEDYFLTGDETKLKPMILKDIAEKVGLDISTISRVANSKYIQTPFGTFLLKSFFSESLQTDSGEEVSTREVKKILQNCVEAEDKMSPLTDDELAKILNEKGYNIARRTIAKYREQLNIPVARLRKEL